MSSPTAHPSRRAVLTGGGLSLLAACSDAAPEPGPPGSAPTRIPATQGLPPGVFSLGVASGDPTPESVVLWTRLAPDPLHGGGLGNRTAELEWQLASDTSFGEIIASGVETVRPSSAHSVHVHLRGLRPDTPYVYRFRAGRQISPTGRTRTLPAADSRPQRLRFALGSCQNWTHGYYTSQRALAAEPDLAFVLFVGDYIYGQAGAVPTVRRHEGSGEPTTLTGYRNRYAQYKTDPALQAAHAAHPWIVAMDDHEVDNNWGGVTAQDDQPDFLARRAAAFRAYYEHMPLRPLSRPRGPYAQFYRRFGFGDLVQLDVLDTRQYRAPNTMLGAAQERWLTDGLRASRARWNLLSSGVMVAAQVEPGSAKDDWDLFPAARARLLSTLAPLRNPMVVSGDRHCTWASDLVSDFGDPDARVLASEVTGTSLTSSGDQDPVAFHARFDPQAQPHWKYWDNRRGFVVCDLDRSRFQAELRAVSTVTDPVASISTGAVFVVEDRVRGLRVAQR